MKINWLIILLIILTLFGCNDNNGKKTGANNSNNMSTKKILGDSVVNFKHVKIEESSDPSLKNVLSEFEVFFINTDKIILYDTEIKSYFEFSYEIKDNVQSILRLSIKDNINDSLGFEYTFFVEQRIFHIKEGYFYTSIFVLDDYLIPISAMVLKRNSSGEKYSIVSCLNFEYLNCKFKRYIFPPIQLDISDVAQILNINDFYDKNMSVINTIADTNYYEKFGCSDKWLLYLDYKEDYLMNDQ